MNLKYLLPIILLNITFTDVYAQAVNDICANATEIQGDLYVNSSTYVANSPSGLLLEVIGEIQEQTQVASSESPQISSNDCYGYTDETNSQFVDVWYKKKIESSSYIANLPLYLYAFDTTHVAIYYGTCGDLFQHRCYTLLPGSYNGLQDYDFLYDQSIINDGDSLYVQISHPESSIPTSFSMMFGGMWSTAYGVYFNYDRPAILSSLTDLTEIKRKDAFIRPNPTEGTFIIETHDVVSEVEIYSINGSLLKTYTSSILDRIFSIDELDNGIYLLRLRYKDGSSQYKKIIKI